MLKRPRMISRVAGAAFLLYVSFYLLNHLIISKFAPHTFKVIHSCFLISVNTKSGHHIRRELFFSIFIQIVINAKNALLPFVYNGYHVFRGEFREFLSVVPYVPLADWTASSRILWRRLVLSWRAPSVVWDMDMPSFAFRTA